MLSYRKFNHFSTVSSYAHWLTVFLILSFTVIIKMKRSLLMSILFVNYAVSLKVISSFTDFEEASNANVKGTLQRNQSNQSIEDLSLCFRFLAFFKQKTTIGSCKYNLIIKYNSFILLLLPIAHFIPAV